METSTFWLICLKILFVYAWKVEYFYYERVQWKDSVKQRRQPLLMKQRRQPSCSFSFSHVNQHQHLRFWFKSFWSESQVTIFRIMFTFIYVFQILEKAAAMWITLQRVVVMCLIYGLLVVLQLCLRFSSYVYLMLYHNQVINSIPPSLIVLHSIFHSSVNGNTNINTIP